MFFFDIVMNSIIQKLKSKNTFLKKNTKWAKLKYFSLVLREREEEKNKYVVPLDYSSLCFINQKTSTGSS